MFDIYFISAVVITAVCVCLCCLCCCNRFLSRRRGFDEHDVDEEATLEASVEMAQRTGRGATTDIIKQFPAFRFYHDRVHLTPLAKFKDLSCCICICEYEDEDEVRVLPCKHSFHADCVDQWLQLNSTCPLCKRDVNVMLGEYLSNKGDRDELAVPDELLVDQSKAAAPSVGLPKRMLAAEAGDGGGDGAAYGTRDAKPSAPAQAPPGLSLDAAVVAASRDRPRRPRGGNTPARRMADANGDDFTDDEDEDGMFFVGTERQRQRNRRNSPAEQYSLGQTPTRRGTLSPLEGGSGSGAGAGSGAGGGGGGGAGGGGGRRRRSSASIVSPEQLGRRGGMTSTPPSTPSPRTRRALRGGRSKRGIRPNGTRGRVRRPGSASSSRSLRSAASRPGSSSRSRPGSGNSARSQMSSQRRGMAPARSRNGPDGRPASAVSASGVHVEHGRDGEVFFTRGRPRS